MDTKKNIIVNKSFEFAVEIVKLCRRLQKEEKEFVLSNQLLKSGTSIGANVQEAQAARSKKDFIAKMAIASKEARETGYWLRLMDATGYVEKSNPEIQKLFEEIESIIKMLTSIVKTSQEKLT